MKAKLKKKSREEIVGPHTAIYHFKIYLLNISPMIGVHQKVWGKIFFIYVIEKLAGSTGILKTILILNRV